MIRVLFYAIFLFFSFLFQVSVTWFVPLTAITPNLLLILVVSWALMRGEQTGIMLGFFAGLAVDIVFGDYLGIYALIFMFLGFVAGKFHRIYTSGGYVLPMVLIPGMDIAYGFACYVLFFLLRSRFAFWFYLFHIILPEAVFTLLVSLPLYPFYFFINERLEAGELRRAKKFV
ncbi:MAG: rod shape-determining protein MreD [Lachnospiraceae bacterium]|nr:rod shape-determining protein MreD [Lachnospiraceae bacterium]